MRVTHFGHACVLVETDRARIVFDPGMFSTGVEELTDVSAVFVTHQHADHIDESVLRALFDRNPGATLVVDPGSAEVGRTINANCQIVEPGDRFTVAGTEVAAVGGEHAVIHSDIPGIPNVGFILDDGAFYHPGDAFHVPDQPIDILGLPIAAPWLKAAEVVEFLRSISPRIAVPIHEAVLANPEWQFPLFEALAPAGTTFQPLARSTPTDV